VRQSGGLKKMKKYVFPIAVFALVIACTPALAQRPTPEPRRYAARLVSPTAGQVLVPGQKVKVEWRAILPNLDLSWCELEVYLSLDGGNTFPFRITPQLDPRASFFYWTVPNLPTNTAVLDIRFGCEASFPESYSPQIAGRFAIAGTTAEVY
jgi:hypothetical protein